MRKLSRLIIINYFGRNSCIPLKHTKCLFKEDLINLFNRFGWMLNSEMSQ